jgi:hypothetical protein
MVDCEQYQKDVLPFDPLDPSIDLRKHRDWASKLTVEQKRIRKKNANQKYNVSETSIWSKRKQYEKDIMKLRKIMAQKGVITKEDVVMIKSLN